MCGEVPKGKLLTSLFKNVVDMKKLKEMVSLSEFEISLLKPTLLLDFFQLSIAVFKSSANHSYGVMKTKTLVSEIVYCLFPSRNISRAFETFTPGDSDNAVIILVHTHPESESRVKDFLSEVNGTEVPIDKLHLFSDIDAIKHLYGITSTTLNKDDLLRIVITKMAAKELA